MQKVLWGLLAAAGLAVLLLWNQVNAKTTEVAEQKARADQLAESLAEQRRQADQLASRFDNLDQTLLALDGRTKANNDELERRLALINDIITKTEGDTDESIACLDVRLPRQLDERMR